ncbi:MAG: shikimate dehydrogenase [candidate division Zixibacteria bacterium]|nr:shikimate dehydrogenase [candidate division Zixibacteria bacterium]
MRNGLHFALIGDDVRYSKSPDIFQAMFRAIGREGRFEIVSLKRDDVRGSLNQLVLEGIRGFAVTIPYKQEIVGSLDDLDPVAQKVGAVNSIAVEGTSLYGYNTDCHGFGCPLIKLGRRAIGGKALIAGCGGAARAVAYSLCHDFGVRDLTVLGRSAERLAEFRKAMEPRLERARIATEVSSSFGNAQTADFDIIVNCTPLGGWHHPNESPLPASLVMSSGKLYYDLNYNDGNQLVAQARERGMTALDGSAMLVAQAIRSFAIWTDQQMPFVEIYRAVFGDRIIFPSA